MPPDHDLDDVRRKLQLDLEYIQNADLWLDARMFLATFLRLFGISGERIMRWAGVRHVAAESQSETEIRYKTHSSKVVSVGCDR